MGLMKIYFFINQRRTGLPAWSMKLVYNKLLYYHWQSKKTLIYVAAQHVLDAYADAHKQGKIANKQRASTKPIC